MVAMNTVRLLRERGHEVAVYAMRYELNVDGCLAVASEVRFDGGVGAKVAALRRTLGLGDIVPGFGEVLRQFRPQVVHLHNIHSYLSPVVARLAHEHGCRVVWTMHDYKLVCPAYTCLRDGAPCDQCVAGSKWGVVRHRCMKGSLAASVVAWLEALRWNRRTLQRCTHAFICPSKFMATMLEKAGFDPERIKIVSNFDSSSSSSSLSSLSSLSSSSSLSSGSRNFNDPKSRSTSKSTSESLLYIGRLSPEKGVERLLEVAAQLPYRLLVAGSGPLDESLRQRYGNCPNIEFLGQLNQQQVKNLLPQVRATVLPSMWWENNPMSVIESLCAGTPVVGTDMGGVPELLTPDNGIVTTIDHLDSAIDEAMQRTWDRDAIASDARQRFSADAHYRQLMQIYTEQ